MALVSSVAHRLTSTKSHRHGLCQRKYVLCCVRFCNSMNNRMTRFMILHLWVLFIFQIRISSIQAYPSKVGCTLIGSSSGSNVMTRTTVMGATPNDVSNLISFSSNTYSSGGQQITVTISNLKSGGVVIHSDKGSLTKPGSGWLTQRLLGNKYTLSQAKWCLSKLHINLDCPIRYIKCELHHNFGYNSSWSI